MIHSKPFLYIHKRVEDVIDADVMLCSVTWRTQVTHEEREKCLVLAGHTYRGVWFFCGRGFIYMNSWRKLFTVPSGVSSTGSPTQKEGTTRSSGSLISDSTSMLLWGSITKRTQTLTTACHANRENVINIPGVLIALCIEKRKEKNHQPD